MSASLVVFRKELIDGLRDRRSVLSALIFPLMFPALITFMFNLIVERDQEADELDIPVVGAEYAPDLVDWFERRGYDVVEGPADPQAAVRDKEHDVVVVITDDFVEDFNAGRTADVELVFDGSRKEASQAVGRVRGLIRGYDRAIGNLRLIARGISPRLGNPVSIDEVDLASARQRSASWFSFIPMIVILATFIGGMNVAIDATAGERERASLESLLVNPVSRRSLARGKWLAASVFSAASVALSLAALLIALSRVPLQQLGIELHVGPREAVGLLLATLPLAFFAAGLQVMLATFARSYKEAQTYLSMLMFLPMVPHFIASMSSLGEAWWMLPIPALGQHVLLTDVLGGEAVELYRILLVVLSPPLLGLACIEVTARLFRRERIIFGR